MVATVAKKMRPKQEAHEDEHEGHSEPHEEHEEHGEPWLVSYADMMTLLFGFFVLMYAFAVAKLKDEDSFVKVRKEIASYFGGSLITPLQGTLTKFQEAALGTPLGDHMEAKLSPEGLEITLRSTAIFASGSAEIKPEAKKTIAVLITMLKHKKEDYAIHIEGHTDDVPIGSIRTVYPSNWELSAARAAAVVRLFESEGIDPKDLSATGYGSARPLVPNRDANGKALPRNQALNRRISIKVTALRTKEEKKKESQSDKKVEEPSASERE